MSNYIYFHRRSPSAIYNDGPWLAAVYEGQPHVGVELPGCVEVNT